MKLKEFIIHQANHIQRGGLLVLFKKIKTVFNLLLMYLGRLVIVIIYSPMYLLLLIISPFLRIRLGEIESRAIGHFSLPIEIYLAEQKMGIHRTGSRCLDIWFSNKKISNSVLLEKWRDYFLIIPAFLIEPLYNICRWAPSGKKHLVPFRHWRDRNSENKFWQLTDIYDVLPKVEPMIKFSLDEINYSNHILSTMGLSESTTYVCFNARNPAYLGEDEFGPRDSSINSNLPAMLALSKLGHKSVRVGSVVSENLEYTDENIIDYSSSGKRTELLDLFIISKCRYMVSTASGIDSVATMFRRPAILVNVCEFGHCFCFNGRYIPLFIPKKTMCIENQQILTFKEVFEISADFFANKEKFKENNLSWVDNTSSEITDLIIEMESRISGSWNETMEDISLQKKFWDIFSYYRGAPPVNVKVGAAFLRNNKNLLN